jgi:hypothetical protein
MSTEDTLILTIACSDRDAPILISQSEYDRLRLIEQKAIAFANAQTTLEKCIAVTRARKRFTRACDELHAVLVKD